MDLVVLNLILVFFALMMIMSGAIVMHFERKKQKRCPYEVIGTSKSALRSKSPVQHSGIGSTYYTGIYEFEYQGNIYEAISRVSTTGVTRKGKKKKIYINPDNPEEYLIDHGVYALVAGLLYAIGIIIIIVVIIVAIV